MGYLFVTRAIKIQWNRGKETHLITSLAAEVIGASTVIKAYFDRWPDQELVFKGMKAVGSLHRGAGYGKQQVAEEKVLARQADLGEQIHHLTAALAAPLVQVRSLEARIATLIREEQRLKATSRVKDGRRILPKRAGAQLESVSKDLTQLQRQAKRRERADPAFQKLEKAEQEWLRLQGQETVYKVDVELDQIMTFFRASLVNLEASLAHLLGLSSLSLVHLVARVLCLPGWVVETPTSKQILLERNAHDPEMLERLARVMPQLNAMRVHTLAGQRLSFGFQ